MKIDIRLFFVASLLLLGQSKLFDGAEYITVVDNFQEFQIKLLTSNYVNAFVFYSENSDRSRMFAPMYIEFSKLSHEYMKAYAIDCESVINDGGLAGMMPVCREENLEYLPAITFFEPPPHRINPYTKKVMNPIEHHYQGDGTPNNLFAYGRQWMPAFRRKIDTKEKLGTFLDHDQIPNKVILFTNKPETSPLYKALTAEFRGRLLFGEIHEDEKELCQEFGVKKFPTLMAVKRTEEGKEPEKITFSDDLKIPKLISFLEKFALDTPVFVDDQPVDQENDEKLGKEKKEEEYKANYDEIEGKSFLEEINKSEKPILVHIAKDQHFKNLSTIENKFQTLFDYFVLNVSNPQNEKFVKEELSIKQFPSLAIFPPGKEKRLNNKLHLSKFTDIAEVTHEISELIPDFTNALSPQEVQAYVNDLTTSKKPILIMFYDTPDVSLSYRVLSRMSRYSDHMKFGKMQNPNAEAQQMFGVQRLPTLIVVFLADPNKDSMEITAEDIKVGHFQGRLHYNELSRFLDNLLPQDKILDEIQITKRVTEVKTQKEFDKICPSATKACIIGLLNGYKGDAESEAKFNDSLETLNTVLKKYSQFPFVWIDAMCHSELLLDFNIQSDFLPTLAVYSPIKKEYNRHFFFNFRFSQLVGTFDKHGISTYLDRYLKGKMGGYPFNKGIVIEERDCEAVHKSRIEAENKRDFDELDEQILKEILDEARKKKEADEADDKKKKKKKKKKNDDL